MRLRFLTVLTAVAALATAGCGTGAALQTQPPRPAETSAVIWECGQRAVVRPRTLAVSCTTNNINARALVWSDWGAETATARGVSLEPTCIPDCAQSRIAARPVILRVSDLVIGDHHAAYAAIAVFTPGHARPQITFSIPTSGPGGQS